MKKFLVVYLGNADNLAKWEKIDGARRKNQEAAGKLAWNKWADENRAAIIDYGSPLGKTKRVNAGGITDIKNNIGAYVIVEAQSHEAAAKIFEFHPHFMIFPGDSIEIMECLAMPKI